jgi:twitching motility protein PilT
MGATDTITLNRILTTAASWRASDLHFLIGSSPIVRVDGRLSPLEDEPIVNAEFIETLLATFLTEDQRRELTAQKEIVVGYSLNPQIRFKVSAVTQRGSLAITLHFISPTLKRLADLGLPAPVQNFAKLTKGLLLITGPYGSGRTTTMNALVNEINETRTANIVTIERPIEYLFVNNHSVIEQREVGRDALTAEQAITTASREDVDVVVVSEAEGKEVLAALLDAAESSRLVISTLPTDSVLNTIEKIINAFPADEQPKARTQLANVLAGILSQRLLPRTGGGLILVAEVMIPSPAVRAVIRDGAMNQFENVVQTSRQPGVQSFDRTLAQLVKAGTISLDDAVANAHEPALLQGGRS